MTDSIKRSPTKSRQLQNFIQSQIDSDSKFKLQESQSKSLEIEDKLKEVINCIQKQHKSKMDIETISEYLQTMPNLVELAKNNADNYVSLLGNIANVLKFERVAQNRALFHYGDPGDKFYFIFKGKVTVIISQLESMDLAEDEYVAYLIKLKKTGETELLNLCERVNHEIFPVNINHINDHLLRLLSKQQIIERKESRLSCFLESTEDKKSSEVSEMRKTYLLMGAKNSLAMSDIINKGKKIEITNFVYNTCEPPEEYVNFLNPEILQDKSKGQRKPLKIYKFKIVKLYDAGDQFGEIALQKASGKRTATLITTDECLFGILDKPSFEKCLNIVLEKHKKNNINYLLTCPILSEMERLTFVRCLFEYFSNHKVKRAFTICTENNEKKNLVYFIKEGEFEVKTKKNFCEINSIAEYFGGRAHKDFWKLQDAESKIKLLIFRISRISENNTCEKRNKSYLY
jgi:CRP-like cAMP-binding protein